LHRQCEVPDLVEKQGAAVRDFNESLLPERRGDERSLAVAEQLAFDQRLRKRGAAEWNKGAAS
jgi:hypothetical protein